MKQAPCQDSSHLSSDHLLSEHLSSERLSSEHLSSERLSSERLSSEHLSSEHLLSEHLSSALLQHGDVTTRVAACHSNNDVMTSAPTLASRHIDQLVASCDSMARMMALDVESDYSSQSERSLYHTARDDVTPLAAPNHRSRQTRRDCCQTSSTNVSEAECRAAGSTVASKVNIQKSR